MRQEFEVFEWTIEWYEQYDQLVTKLQYVLAGVFGSFLQTAR